ncbi:MAG TPA: type II secretion system protein [Phycisphaerae bacterium]|nr:type II secretion system protein [Phycisphaerae bacterium]
MNRSDFGRLHSPLAASPCIDDSEANRLLRAPCQGRIRSPSGLRPIHQTKPSPWAGEIAAPPPRVRRGGRAFTLVELITVMAIMATLMAMIVGVVPQIQDAWRARITRTRLLAVVAALQAYAEDYNDKYPWTADDVSTRDVTTTTGLNEKKVLFPAEHYPSSGWQYYEEAILYAALTSTLRRGPYYRAAGGQAVVRKDGTQEFNLLADGWERPILYEYETATSLLVRSVGKDGATGGDNSVDDIFYFVFEN